jgi:hypothetical protein
MNNEYKQRLWRGVYAAGSSGLETVSDEFDFKRMAIFANQSANAVGSGAGFDSGSVIVQNRS